MKRSAGKLIGCIMVVCIILSGCANNSAQPGTSTDTLTVEDVAVDPSVTEQTAPESASGNSSEEDMIMEIQLGYNGQTIYRVQLYDNVTARELYRDIGDHHYNLPIYHYNDFEQADVIQYYDLPARYSYTVEDAVEVEEVKAGELYYSDPNRIILVYRDTVLDGEYVPIGMVEIDDPENFAKEMENSEVLEYWECKVIPVHRLGVEFSR